MCLNSTTVQYLAMILIAPWNTIEQYVWWVAPYFSENIITGESDVLGPCIMISVLTKHSVIYHKVSIYSAKMTYNFVPSQQHADLLGYKCGIT